jgi:putative nucleotidyltransferase-like protein
VKHKLAQSVVDFLSFSEEVSDRACFRQYSDRDWQRTLPWVHETGLALYFLQKLKDTNTIATLPSQTLFHLEKSFQANLRRLFRLLSQFDLLNRKFEAAGIVYAAVKGFSLIPEFCPNPHLRQQSDFDYVITDESLPGARRVLEHAGYAIRTHSSNDYLFCLPTARFLPMVHNQYSADAPCPVELHLSLWDSNARDICLAEPTFNANHTVHRQYRELTFRGLADEIQFLFQVTHLFYHISNYWVRLSWLFEIAYFLKQRAADAPFWIRIEQHIGDDPVLQEIVALIAILAQQFFAGPLPLSLESWTVRPAVRIWVQRYACAWAFGNNQVHNLSFFPTAKLTLFLLQHYVPDQRHFIWSRMFPSQRLTQVARSLKANPSRILDEQFRGRERLVRRILFHLAANLRYVCEQPRWRYLNKTAVQSSAV